MAEQTAIEWCDATFNPWWGCEKISPGCAHCYADTLARRYGHAGTWGAGHGFRFFGDKHWAEPLKWARTLPVKLGRRPRVFCASMADVFEDRDELEEHRERLFSTIIQTPGLDWLVLTKRPEFARSWLTDFYDRIYWGYPRVGDEWEPLHNLWLGVSIENARHTYRADVLRQIPAAVRFISAEPLLGSLYPKGDARDRAGLLAGTHRSRGDDGRAGTRGTDGGDRGDQAGRALGDLAVGRGGSQRANESVGRAPLDLTDIDWVIAGGESGPGHRPLHLDHARELRDAILDLCDGCAAPGRGSHAVGVDMPHTRPAFFFKQVGGRTPKAGGKLLDGRDWNEMPR